MIEVAVYSTEGKKIETVNVDEAVLGKIVRYRLLKQALVMYHANRRQGTVATKSRGLVEGSTRKLYAQKHTGNARAGNARTCIRKGGGVAFGKVPRDFRQAMPKKQRRLARDSAVLAKLMDQNVVVIQDLTLDRVKSKDFAKILENLGICRSCLVATKALQPNVYKSARNLTKVAVMPVAELNADAVCRYQKLLFTKESLLAFLDRASSN